MTSVRNSTAYLAALAAMGLIAGGMSSASAADLGGNCCADLEERIAELEATTARKGNRKVSLVVSGYVNEAVFFWDDGSEQNIYVGTNSLEQTRFRFTGEAKIVDGWSAGYALEIGVAATASNTFNQNLDNGSATSGLTVRQSHWFLKSKDYGKLSVGLTGTATYHLLDDADGTNTRNYADAEAAAVALGAFQLRVAGAAVGANVRWNQVLRGANNATPGQSGRRNVVRYDSPAIAGFTVTAAWGEDDLGDVALTYKGDIGDFKVTGKAGYGQITDENTQTCHTQVAGVQQDCQWWGVAGTVMHAPTGFYVYAGYGEQQDDTRKLIVATADDTDVTWFVQGGIEKKFTPYGTTTFFGEYRHDDAGSNPAASFAVLGVNGIVQSSDIDHVAVGLVQNIDAAAMDLYVIYRHAQGDITNSANRTLELDDFDVVITGVRLQF